MICNADFTTHFLLASCFDTILLDIVYRWFEVIVCRPFEIRASLLIFHHTVFRHPINYIYSY